MRMRVCFYISVLLVEVSVQNEFHVTEDAFFAIAVENSMKRLVHFFHDFVNVLFLSEICLQNAQLPLKVALRLHQAKPVTKACCKLYFFAGISVNR